jgi:hypothetical protein
MFWDLKSDTATNVTQHYVYGVATQRDERPKSAWLLVHVRADSIDYTDSLQIAKLAYRNVFEVPVFLYVFHVLQAWKLQVRNKLRDKGRWEEALNALHGILHLRATGTLDDRCAAVDRAIVDFKQAFATEMPLLDFVYAYGTRHC